MNADNFHGQYEPIGSASEAYTDYKEWNQNRCKTHTLIKDRTEASSAASLTVGAKHTIAASSSMEVVQLGAPRNAPILFAK